MEIKIDELREMLVKAAEEKTKFTDDEVIRISKLLDEYIVKIQQKAKGLK
ncbi:MAG: aspartyl-phosphate phosphatase Spo0E family protein [Paenibacillus sp.]|nr:aspartyl-phosphate phosphatase Spo0E family protein [Paenibacillus sp.]